MPLSTILMRRRAIATACVACTTAVAAFGATALAQTADGSTATAAASASRCSTSGLVPWLRTEGNGAAGSVYYQLQLTNLSGRTCTLSGYPGVSAISLSGGQLGRSATRESGAKARTITLKNGQSATATLRIVEAGNFPTKTCKPVMAAGLRVYPPNQKTAKTVPFPFEACASTSVAVLSVGPVKPS